MGGLALSESMAEQLGHGIHDTRPITCRVLPEKSGGWIPRRIRPFSQPAPVVPNFQDNPDRPRKRPGQMAHGGIDRDDEIETFHHRRGIEKGAGTAVEIRPEVLNLEAIGDPKELYGASTFLQADEAHTGNLSERRKFGHIHGATLIRPTVGIALPADADLETMGADALAPCFDTGSRKITNENRGALAPLYDELSGPLNLTRR